MPVNGINPNAAIGAYLNSQRITGGEGAVTVQTAATGPMGIGATPGLDLTQNTSGSNSPSFADFLQNKVEQSVQTMQKSEDMAGKAITGEADLTDIVQAVTDAELTLQTLVAVRDKMISAYQEIMRMQI